MIHIKRFWRWLTHRSTWESSIDSTARFQQAYINRFASVAESVLADNGWKIISTDTRIFWYSWRVMKYDIVETFSIDEVLRMGGYNPDVLREKLRKRRKEQIENEIMNGYE